jgi:sugar transferase (PEP-CTERM system associated)
MRSLGVLSFLFEGFFLLAAFQLAALRASSLIGKPVVGDHADSLPNLWIGSTIFGIVIIGCLYLNGLYDFRARFKVGELWLKLMGSFAVSLILLLVVDALVPRLSVGRVALIGAVVLASAFLLPWRHFVMGRARQNILAERVLIIGSDDTALAIAGWLENHEHLGYKFLGIIADPALTTPEFDGNLVIGTPDQLLEVALNRRATKIVVAQQDSRGHLSLDTLLECKTSGIPVWRASDFYEKTSSKILLDDIRIKSWLTFSEGFVITNTYLFAKRWIDLIVSAIGLVIAAPLMVIIAVAVRLDSPGPILYRQERIGYQGEPFMILKFRSMKKGAESGTGPRWAKKADDRITRVGHVLRRLRLDEIPQLWNVLRGDMSLVGPRPEREAFMEELAEASQLYEYRHAVRPGITGWAQVNNGYAASVSESMEKLGYDLYYLRHISVLFDLLILAKSIKVVLLGQGAH